MGKFSAKIPPYKYIEKPKKKLNYKVRQNKYLKKITKTRTRTRKLEANSFFWTITKKSKKQKRKINYLNKPLNSKEIKQQKTKKLNNKTKKQPKLQCDEKTKKLKNRYDKLELITLKN